MTTMDDTYDDGLVHGHNWASEPSIPASGTKLTAPESAAPLSASPAEEFFDDGLVHGHDWARG
jgi:hypothetical protein